MSRDQLARRGRRLLERLSQPSSAASLALTVVGRRRHRRDGAVRVPGLQRTPQLTGAPADLLGHPGT